MEKYGVAFDEEKTKTAEAVDGKFRCPRCGAAMTKAEREARNCPTCGTAPFERRLPDGGEG
jgi:rubrerythrin